MAERILVTGAAGYLGSWVVERLLSEGFEVHATVRHVGDRDKAGHLHKLADDYPGKLSLFEADLLRPHSFDQAMAGCSVVIHTASPYFRHQPEDVAEELVRPALNGTLNVLESVNRTPTVRRVVLTSSIATLYNDARDVAGHTVQEADVNANRDMAYNSYAYSKTVAEKAAWDEQARQSRWDLVSLHPGAIFGPSLSHRTDGTSVDMVRRFLGGSFKAGVPRLWLGVVDVRDAAMAHVQAARLASASGRYIIVSGSHRLLEISKMMRVADYGIPDKLPRGETSKALVWLIAPLVGMTRRFVARNVNYPLAFNNERSRRELGMRYRPPEQTFNDHIRQIVVDGLLLPA